MRIRRVVLAALSSTAVLSRSVPGANPDAISGYKLPIGQGARSIESPGSDQKRGGDRECSLAARGMPHLVEPGPHNALEEDLALHSSGLPHLIEERDEDIFTVVVTSVRTLTENPSASPPTSAAVTTTTPTPNMFPVINTSSANSISATGSTPVPTKSSSSTSQSYQTSSATASGSSQAPHTSSSTASVEYHTRTVTITESDHHHRDATGSQSPSMITYTTTVTHHSALFPFPASPNWPKNHTTTVVVLATLKSPVYVPVTASSSQSLASANSEFGSLISSVLTATDTNGVTIQTANPSSSVVTSSKSSVSVVAISGPLGVSAVTITDGLANSASPASATAHTDSSQPSPALSNLQATTTSTVVHSVTLMLQTQSAVSSPQSNPGPRLAPPPVFLVPARALKSISSMVAFSYIPIARAAGNSYFSRSGIAKRNTTQIVGNVNNINITVTKDVSCSTTLSDGSFNIGCQKSAGSRSVRVPGILALPAHLIKTAKAQLQPTKRTCYGDPEDPQGLPCSAGTRSLAVPSILTFPSLLVKQAMAWPETVKRTCYGDPEGSQGVSCSAGSRSLALSSSLSRIFSLPSLLISRVFASSEPAQASHQRRKCYDSPAAPNGQWCDPTSSSPATLSLPKIFSFPSKHCTLFLSSSAWLFCLVAGAVGLAWLRGWLYAGSEEWERVAKELLERAERETCEDATEDALRARTD